VCSSVWDRLRRLVRVEYGQLDDLIEAYRSVVARCAAHEPDAIELAALAAMLHSFYTGIENMLKRVAVEVDGGLPSGESWHHELLNQMTVPTNHRSQVLSQPLSDALADYLHFRHLFRHAYTFDLRWEKMSGLVLACEELLAEVKRELDSFLGASDPTDPGPASTSRC